MAENSLITKAHLRSQSEKLLEKLNDADTVTGAAINSHNTNTEAHPDIRNAIPKKASDRNAPTVDEMNAAIEAKPSATITIREW